MLWICIFLGWAGVHKFIEKKTGMGILYLFTCGLFGIGWLVDCVKYLISGQFGFSVRSKKIKAKKRLEADEPLPYYMTNVILGNGESCHYSDQVYYRIVKNRVVGYNADSSSTSFRIMKGVTVRTGGTKGAAIRGNVVEETKGMLTVTNQRILFSSTKVSFDKKISTLSSVIPYTDGLEVQFGSNTYQFATNDGQYICDIIKRVSMQQMAI